MSSGNTARQIQFMMDLHSPILCCTPSYAAYIGESLAEQGIRPEDNCLQAGIFGPEPWTEEMRRSIAQSLRIPARHRRGASRGRKGRAGLHLAG